MRWWCPVVTIVFGLAASISDASRAAVDIRVDLANQTMRVVSSDGETHVWPVSTARKGFVTPRGTYGVQSLQRLHLSRKYHNSPMPYSIFFRGGYAIHGTYSTASLGRAASHGCIRLAPRHAATLFQMVKAEGAHISIVGAAPRDVASREQREHHHTTQLAARRIVAPPPFAYAPLAPSYDDWMRDPAEDD